MKTLLTLALVALLVLPQLASAQTPYSYRNGGYNPAGSYDFGSLGGFLPQAPESDTINILNANAGADSGGIDLGCGEISYDSFFKNFIGVGVGDVNKIAEGFMANGVEAMKSELVKRSLTELYSMPQVAAVLDGVKSAANASFDMMTQSCDFNEIQTEVREATIQKCVDDKVAAGADPGGARQLCEPTTAGSVFADYLGPVKEYFGEFTQQFSAPAQNLANMICRNEADSCYITNLLPQFRLCAKGLGMGGCQDINKATQTAEPVISAAQMYDGMVAITQTAYGHMTNGVQYTISQLDADTALSVRRRQLATQAASGFEVVSNGNAGYMPAEGIEVAQLQFIDFGTQTFASQKPDVVDEFKKFMHCAYDDPMQDIKGFAEQLKQDKGLDIDSIIKISEEDKLQARRMFDFSNVTGLEASVMTNLVTDAEDTAALVEAAVGCVANHQIHVGVDTLIALNDLTPKDRQAYVLAASSRVAHLTTELLLRFMRQKILAAHVTMSAGMDPVMLPECAKLKSDPAAMEKCFQEKSEKFEGFEIPQGVYDSVLTIAEMFENQIKALQALKTERDAFAKITALIAQKRAALLNININR